MHPPLVLAVLVAAASLPAAGCRKQEASPGYTGANTFGCQIDGAPFTPHLDPVLLTTRQPLRAMRTTQRGGFYLEAQNALNVVYWNVTGVAGPGTYALGYARFPLPYAPNTASFAGCRRYRALTPADDPYNPPQPTEFYTDAVNVGTVTFARYDTVARIAGGTFEFTARDAASGALVRVSGGAFDVKF